ncbi:hypothetical protein [Spirosoma oryzicola]|uniref:hypothetical protein n=1 Tax=Spirosoma oryzicola TaxID=2898794 RepID=UPI001E3D99EB|nr:hypothetical protein [Spirosoma oryzicola]UHG91743.1 hypothetical protein LQ777_02320 [Spirosoma oryzicola]
MFTVTFSFDLGDCKAIYTGRIVGLTDEYYKVTYFEPRVRELLSIDLRKDQVLSRGHSKERMLPLSPTVVETPVPETFYHPVQPLLYQA